MLKGNSLHFTNEVIDIIIERGEVTSSRSHSKSVENMTLEHGFFPTKKKT